MKRVNLILIVIMAEFSCPFCEKVFKSRNGVWVHKHKVHPDLVKPITRRQEGGRLCGICGDQKLPNLARLCEHLQETHGISAAVEEFKCESDLAFQNWKSDLEREGNVEFVRERERIASSSGWQEEFVCHRSGNYESKACAQSSRAPRATPTIKIGFCCSAFIRVKKTESGAVSVTACLSHYGHDIDAKYCHVG